MAPIIAADELRMMLVHVNQNSVRIMLARCDCIKNDMRMKGTVFNVNVNLRNAVFEQNVM